MGLLEKNLSENYLKGWKGSRVRDNEYTVTDERLVQVALDDGWLVETLPGYSFWYEDRLEIWVTVRHNKDTKDNICGAFEISEFPEKPSIEVIETKHAKNRTKQREISKRQLSRILNSYSLYYRVDDSLFRCVSVIRDIYENGNSVEVAEPKEFHLVVNLQENSLISIWNSTK